MGYSNHQHILNSIVDSLKGNPNINTIGIFGSLARGDYDQDSD